MKIILKLTVIFGLVFFVLITDTCAQKSFKSKKKNYRVAEYVDDLVDDLNLEPAVTVGSIPASEDLYDLLKNLQLVLKLYIVNIIGDTKNPIDPNLEAIHNNLGLCSSSAWYIRSAKSCSRKLTNPTGDSYFDKYFLKSRTDLNTTIMKDVEGLTKKLDKELKPYYPVAKGFFEMITKNKPTPETAKMTQDFVKAVDEKINEAMKNILQTRTLSSGRSFFGDLVNSFETTLNSVADWIQRKANRPNQRPNYYESDGERKKKPHRGFYPRPNRDPENDQWVQNHQGSGYGGFNTFEKNDEFYGNNKY